MSPTAAHPVSTPSVLLVLLVLAVGSACSGGDPGSAPTPGSGASVTSAPPPPAPPEVGECHELTLAEATDPVAAETRVPCAREHHAVTVGVGRVPALADGHLLAVDSPTVRARIAAACPPLLARYVGGEETTRRLSRFEAVSFAPSLAQADAGADRFRCDAVALRREGELLPLPRRIEGVLDAPDALDRFGTCGTAAPSARTFERVACSEKHSWRAVDVVEIPKSTRYLAEDATAAGDAACKDVAADRAAGALEFTWSFEWPTRPQWAAGQRYGYCWVPTT